VSPVSTACAVDENVSTTPATKALIVVTIL
jgi:hypothetical protein